MKQLCLKRLTASFVLAMTLCSAPLAFAATGPAQGDTSGPAAGTQTTPSAAVQKQVSNPNGSTNAGAPGATGKAGAESGDKPATPPSHGPSTTR